MILMGFFSHHEKPRGRKNDVRIAMGWRALTQRKRWLVKCTRYISIPISQFITPSLLCIKQVTNENLPDSTGNSTRYSVMTKIEKKSKKEGIYVYI